LNSQVKKVLLYQQVVKACGQSYWSLWRKPLKAFFVQ